MVTEFFNTLEMFLEKLDFLSCLFLLFATDLENERISIRHVYVLLMFDF